MMIRLILRTHPYGQMGSGNNQRCGDSTGTYHNRNPAPSSSQYIAGGRAGLMQSFPAEDLVLMKEGHGFSP
jgi:hypothetical protein